MSASKIPYVKHNNGTQIQSIGLGTYTSLGGDCERATLHAIDVGYRHIDTAFFYENEAEVGNAVRQKIKEGVIKREDISITTKLWCHFHEPNRVEYACRKTLENFGLDYVDLYLMHWPYSYVYRSDTDMMPTDSKGEVELSDVDYLDTWRAMEKLVELGLTKSIGVSNFNSEQLTRLLANCKIKPIHNQIECHPALNQKKLIALCKKHDIVVTAYCPLGRPDPANKKPNFIYDAKVQAIADKHKKSTAQVVLRYLIEIGAVPLPKSSNPKRIEENLNVFDFQLDAADHKVLDTYNSGERLIQMEHARKSKHYPFNIEY
ncbi:aldo-keto reductase family 1 member B1 [Scaptodrosophila lebanonensis]|uniref:Aldo-keto reductase family 1 member B1 n=1 Tax=Drosophila lebanonensis TaxID=7225 RepID=A0A6J2TVI5_DROLE|nr:aldo-keto reductase family 1 member B1 [Scaptodrosophila lebanonensis]